MRKYWIFLITTVVLVVGAFGATLASGHSPVLGLDLQGGVSVVLSPVGNFTPDSLDVAVDVIRNRVDGLGVAEAEITRQGNDIVVDLPGVKDRDRAQRIVGRTAELRFRPVVGLLPPASSTASSGTASTATTTGGATTTTGPESTTTTTTPPSASDAAAKAAVASCDTKTLATLTEIPTTSVADDQRDKCVVLPGRDPKGVRYLLGKTALTGKGVDSAKSEFQSSEGYVVVMNLTGDGNTKFNALAAQQFAQPSPSGQAGGHGAIAITLDGIVQSAPEVQTPSFTGNVQITGGKGGFPPSDASDLAKLINYGALPVQLKQVNVQDVSPTLGDDQLRAGIIAGLIGLALVAVYMVVFYRLLGLVVIFGLMLSGMTLYSVITYLGQSQGLALTLAGVTGIIVSAGVTVDSYVVYFERLKDELRGGATIRACADRAFHRSFRTIVAADLVSLIGAVVLYILAIGSVRGFAFFLGLSTLIDLVLSYFVMYPLVVLMSRRPHLVRMKGVGMAAGLDAPAVMA
ncbi:MAG: protein translocase subunit SecD [Acidimicrobiia bacterium]